MNQDFDTGFFKEGDWDIGAESLSTFPHSGYHRVLLDSIWYPMP